jgi:hypothetical protein
MRRSLVGLALVTSAISVGPAVAADRSPEAKAVLLQAVEETRAAAQRVHLARLYSIFVEGREKDFIEQSKPAALTWHKGCVPRKDFVLAPDGTPMQDESGLPVLGPSARTECIQAQANVRINRSLALAWQGIAKDAKDAEDVATQQLSVANDRWQKLATEAGYLK